MSRYRQAEVVCHRGHRVLDVIGVDPKWERPVMMFRPGPSEIVAEADGVGEVTAGQLHRGEHRPHVVWWFTARGTVEASCSCGWWAVDLAWVSDEINQGRKRLPLSYADPV